MIYQILNTLKNIEISKIFNKLAEEKSFQFRNLKRKSDPGNLVYRHKTKGISPKDFSNYQNPMNLFINLRDGNIKSRDLLKDQINFKSDIGETKK